VNGTRVASVSGVSGTQSANKTVNIGQDPYANNLRFSGYLSNLRVVKGTAVYSPSSSTITVPTTPLTAISGTSLLTCQANRFFDASSNTFAITANGTMSVQRFNPFGTSTAYSTSVIGGSGYFDTSGDYVTFSPSTSFAFGTGDFTIEFWINTGGVSADGAVLDSTTNGSYWAIRFNGTTLYYQSASGIANIATPTISTLSQSAWTHVALVRASGTTKIYANGVQVSSTADSTNYTATTTYQIAKSSDSNRYTGFFSDIRVVKGTAVYTAAFTPPTAPLTAITNTSFLTSYTNGAIFDNAMMNDLETVGNAQISTSVKKYGTGSLAFDGTTDYLQAPTNQIYALGTGNFTIEFWVYANSWTATASTVVRIAGASDWVCQFDGSGVMNFYANGAAQLVDSGSPSTGVWTHYAIVRSGTSLKMYRSGTSVASATYATSIGASNVLLVGCGGDSNNTLYCLNGYIDDLRITKGYARYTANFTEPTSALSDTGPY